jgi:FMN phosphatase YigB (HAD superfamily)
MKTVSLNVPDSFQLPAVYTSETLDTVSIALSLGAEAYDTLYMKAMDRARHETSTELIETITQQYSQKMLDAQETADAQIKRLRSEKQRFEEALSLVRHQLELYEQSSASVRTEATASAREMYGELLTSKEKQIVRLEGLLEKQIETVVGKVDTLQNSITRTFSSSKDKGTYGESVMEGLLKKAFDCEIIVVAKDAQTADIRMIRNSEHEYFWEAKNYSRMVSSEEVEKFRRDMRLHPKVRAGCLVSLRTGVVGHARGGDIDLEFMEDGRCILFLSNFLNREDPIFYLQTLRPFFDVLEANTHPVKEESEMLRGLEAKAALITNLLRSHASSVAKHRNSIVTHRKRIDTMFSEFQGYILEADSQLQTLLRIAVGNDSVVETAQVEADTILPSIFKKPNLTDYDTRQKQFITWLLSLCSFKEGSTVEIKVIVEAGKAKGFGEKWIRDLREEVFQDSAWVRGARFISGLVLNNTV